MQTLKKRGGGVKKHRQIRVWTKSDEMRSQAARGASLPCIFLRGHKMASQADPDKFCPNINN